MAAKRKTSVGLTPEAVRLLQKLAKKLGISMAGVMELAIRQMAERQSV
jgi:predicted transcriptional regulator